MPAITGANVANAIVKLVAAKALPALVGTLVMGNLVHRDFEPTLASQGDTINVPIPPVMVANDIAEIGSVQPQNPNLGNAQIVLNKHVESSFTIPDVTRALAHPDLLQMYMEPAIIAVAESIETYLLGKYAGFDAIAPVGAAGTPLTEAVLDTAETALFNAKVPAALPKHLVVSANEYSVLRQIPRFTEMDKYGSGDAIITGSIGKVKDFTVFRSQFVSKTGASPANTHNLAFTRPALALVIRRLPQPLPGTGAIAEYAELGNFGVRVVMSYAPNTLSQQFTVDVLYGAGVLRNSFGLQVNS